MVLHLITAIITLIYLGWSPNDTSKFDPKDWKRKWIVFFTWLNVALLLIISCIAIGRMMNFVKEIPSSLRLFYGSSFSLILIIIIALGILDTLFTLQYLGTSFKDIPEPNPKDWKRQWIIIMSWIVLVSGLIQLVSTNNYINQRRISYV